jgi:hypothetical protein
VSYLSKINVNNSSYLIKEKIENNKKEKNDDIGAMKFKNKKEENVIDIAHNLEINTSEISGITPINKNNNDLNKNNFIIENNTQKQLIDIFDNVSKEKKSENNDKIENKNKKYQLSEGKNNYSNESESLVLNNLKDYKFNQTNSSENYNESILQNQVKELKIRSKTMKDKLTIFLNILLLSFCVTDIIFFIGLISLSSLLKFLLSCSLIFFLL